MCTQRTCIVRYRVGKEYQRCTIRIICEKYHVLCRYTIRIGIINIIMYGYPPSRTHFLTIILVCLFVVHSHTYAPVCLMYLLEGTNTIIRLRTFILFYMLPIGISLTFCMTKRNFSFIIYPVLPFLYRTYYPIPTLVLIYLLCGIVMLCRLNLFYLFFLF